MTREARTAGAVKPAQARTAAPTSPHSSTDSLVTSPHSNRTQVLITRAGAPAYAPARRAAPRTYVRVTHTQVAS